MARSISCALALTALLAWSAARAAETANPTVDPENTPATDTQTELPTAEHATMAKRGKVHFGPSLYSKEACVLEAGTDVEVLGIAKGLPDWYVVRFPRAGTAWVHHKVLEPLDGGKKFRITQDRARARDDSTLRSNIIAELAKGEIVEAKGRTNGDWVAVYPPSAVAYIHRTVLNLPAASVQNIAVHAEHANHANQDWLEAKAIYARYKAVLDRKDYEVAATLDWDNLATLVARVAQGHPNAEVRKEAQELSDGIAKVVAVATNLQHDRHIAPLREIPGEPPIVVTPPAPVPTGTDTSDAGGGAHATPAPGGTTAKPVTQTKPGETGDLQKAANAAPAAPAPGDFVVTGLINEQAFPQLGTTHVILNQDGKILAVLKVKPGSALQLSEFFWANVGIVGKATMIDAAKVNQTGTIPLVEVEDVRLLH